jgi:hypothetical protein
MRELVSRLGKRRLAMCDYSLENVASRKAKQDDKLVSTRFAGTFTRGFAAADDLSTAVCLAPGTEIAFEAEIRYEDLVTGNVRTAQSKVARFRQVDLDMLYAHHDALEFPDGNVVRVARLLEGQHATVLQLPSTAEKQAGQAIAAARKVPDPLTF